MSKWCDTCYRNEAIGEWKSCDDSCPVFGKHFEQLARYVVEREVNYVADFLPQTIEIEMLRILSAKHKAFFCGQDILGYTLQDQITENYNAHRGEFDGFCYSSKRAKAVFRTLEDMAKDGIITKKEYDFCNEQFWLD